MSDDISDLLQDALSVIQCVNPPFMPANPEVMTVVVEYPAGGAGLPPHRHPGGPAFGYVLDGEMLFELEGEAPRVISAGRPLGTRRRRDPLLGRKQSARRAPAVPRHDDVCARSADADSRR